jgi:hypothetical protein
MHRYYVTSDLIWLEQVNARGHGPSNTTRKWVEILYHPDGTKAAAKVPESFLPRLGDILTTEEYDAVTANWLTEEQVRNLGFDV